MPLVKCPRGNGAQCKGTNLAWELCAETPTWPTSPPLGSPVARTLTLLDSTKKALFSKRTSAASVSVTGAVAAGAAAAGLVVVESVGLLGCWVVAIGLLGGCCSWVVGWLPLLVQCLIGGHSSLQAM